MLFVIFFNGYWQVFNCFKLLFSSYWQLLMESLMFWYKLTVFIWANIEVEQTEAMFSTRLFL